MEEVPKILKDFWVLTDSGIVLFSKVYDQKVNPQLFGALMSALNKFAEALSDGGISSFEKSDLRFVIIKRRKFLFIGSSVIKTKEKKVIDELMQISDIFFRTYEKTLINWDNDVSVFSDFGDFIDKSLEK
ncbi:MAG: hypothetical protein ACFE8G_07950 [Candidatus Hermodarchaeota archaeon]